MQKKSMILLMGLLSSTVFLIQCAEKKETAAPAVVAEQKPNYGGFESQVKWGEHLVTIGGCQDCHSPKKMTDHGPVIDSSLSFSGHPEKMPVPDINRKEVESKGLIVTNTLTAWVGPWGISYAANISSDATGIGNWPEENFFRALREGKSKGLPNSRPLLPPMPWEGFRNMTDDEIRAVFAYLKTTKPIKNNVPPATPPVTAMAK